jgi:hypothetical protein
MVSASDGSAFTGSVTVSVTGDAGTQATGSVSSGACTHEGNGYHTYAPAQAETNYDLIAFTFTGSGAVPATVQIETRIDANVTHYGGTAGTFSSGIAAVNTTQWGGSATPVTNLGTVFNTDFTSNYDAANKRFIASFGKTIYVATTGNDSNAGTAASPKLTVAGAISAMNDWDRCVIGAGTFTGLMTCSLNHCTFEGQGQGVTILTYSLDTTWKVSGDHNTIRNMSVTNSKIASGYWPIDCSQTWGTTLENLTLTGTYDSFLGLGCINFKAKGCLCTADYDGANLNGSINFVCDDCSFYTTGNWDQWFDLSLVTPEADGYRGMYMSTDSAGTFNNCVFRALQSRASTKPVVACMMGGDNETFIHNGTITFNSCTFDVTSSHASSSGLVACISNDTTFSLQYFAVLNNCKMKYSNSGSGNSYHVYAPVSGTKAILNGCQTHTTLTSDTLSRVFTNLSSATAGLNKVAVDSSNQVTAGTLGTQAKTDVQSAMTSQGFTTTRASKLDRLDIAVSDVPDLVDIGAVTDTNSESVPSGRKFKLIHTKDRGLIGETERSIRANMETTLSIDFANDLQGNGWIKSVDAVDVVSGTGLTLANFGRGLTEAKFRASASAAGQYEIQATVTYNTGSAGCGLVVLNVPSISVVSEGGTPGSTDTIDLTDVDQEPVPDERIFKLISTKSSGLVGDKAKSIRLDAPATTYAIDFNSDLPLNGRVATFSSLEIVSGTAGGLTITELTRDDGLAKFRIEPVTAGTYTLNGAVVYTNGDGARCEITYVVFDA